jgi:hypothetical protein
METKDKRRGEVARRFTQRESNPWLLKRFLVGYGLLAMSGWLLSVVSVRQGVT